MSRNIEINIKQESQGGESSYEVLYPKTVSKNILYSGEDAVTVWDKLNNLNPDSTLEVGDILYTNRINLDPEKWHLCDGSLITNGNEALRLDITAELSDEVIDIWPKLKEVFSKEVLTTSWSNLRISSIYNMEDLYVVNLSYTTSSSQNMSLATKDFLTFKKLDDMGYNILFFIKKYNNYYFYAQNFLANYVFRCIPEDLSKIISSGYTLTNLFEVGEKAYATLVESNRFYIAELTPLTNNNTSFLNIGKGFIVYSKTNVTRKVVADESHVYFQMEYRTNSSNLANGIYTGSLEEFKEKYEGVDTSWQDATWMQAVTWNDLPTLSQKILTIKQGYLFFAGEENFLLPTADFFSGNLNNILKIQTSYGLNTTFSFTNGSNFSQNYNEYFYCYYDSTLKRYYVKFLKFKNNIPIVDICAFPNGSFLRGKFESALWSYSDYEDGGSGLVKLNINFIAPKLTSNSNTANYYIKISE